MASTRRKRRTTRKHGTARKRKRRGVRGLGDYDSANVRALHREQGSECERQNAKRVSMGLKPRPCAPTAAAVARSEGRAENKGCKPPKGRVCVGADIAKVGRELRQGCKRGSPKGTYYCTESAVKMHAAGKARRAGRHADKGLHKASWKEAVNKLTGQFKPGCAYSFKLHTPICKTKKK